MSCKVNIIVKELDGSEKVYDTITEDVRVGPFDGTIRDVIGDIAFNIFRNNYTDDEFMRFVNTMNCIKKLENKAEAIQKVNQYLCKTEKLVFNQDKIIRLFYFAEVRNYMGDYLDYSLDNIQEFTFVIDRNLTQLDINYEWLDSLK